MDHHSVLVGTQAVICQHAHAQQGEFPQKCIDQHTLQTPKCLKCAKILEHLMNCGLHSGTP